MGKVREIKKKLRVFFASNLNKLTKFFDKSVLEIQNFRVGKNLGDKKTSDYEFFLIVGCPRSGTTVLQTILSIHPDIKSPQGEFDFSSRRLMKEIGDVFGPIEMKETRKDYLFLENLFREFAKNKKLLIKRPTATFYLNYLFQTFPRMRVINMIRDGRDVVQSLKANDNFEWPTPFSCYQWKKAVEIRKKYGEIPGYLEIKYEELLKNPFKIVNQIFLFFGIKKLSKNKIMSFYKGWGEDRKLLGGSDQPLYKSSVKRWKKEMSEKDKKIFKKIAGKKLIELGYEKDNNW